MTAAARSVAVIGAGMAGLAAARRCGDAGLDVTVFEAHDGFGMDIHALDLHGGTVDVPLRVMSPQHWRAVLALADEVGVGTFPVTTRVSCSNTHGRTWFRSGRVPLVEWSFVGSWRYLDARALRLARGMSRLARSLRGLHAMAPDFTLDDYLARERPDPLFWRGLVLPLLTTICTCSEARLRAWPAAQLLSLLDDLLNHASLVRLEGGTRALVRGLSRGLTLCGGSRVTRVAEVADGVEVQNARGDGGCFDHAIVATQANQLEFLSGDALAAERDVLAGIAYDSGELLVHEDPRLMPQRRRDWTALNFQADDALESVAFTVHVNAVEPTLAGAPPVFQSWNPLVEPDAARVHARVPLQRAVVHTGTAGILKHVARWHAQPQRRVWYCGSWAYEGVPLLETAVRSAEAVAGRITAAAVG